VRVLTPRPTVDQAESTKLRLTFLAMMMVSLFVLLLARLWFLQVMAGERYVDAAQTNALRAIPVEAPRGRILDRDGTVLVDNRYAVVVSVAPDEMGEQYDTVMADLADLLGSDVATLERAMTRSRVSELRPKPVAVDVPEDIAAYIYENSSTLYPGVYVENLPFRTYPEGDLAAHVLGYVGEISDAELAEERYAGYRPGDLIGWAGLERTYENVLQGTKGEQLLEVNRSNEVVDRLPERLPVPGDDVVTTLDAEIQADAEEALAEGITTARTVMHRDSGRQLEAPAGAVVVLDPRNGEVRAMASFPTYDPDEFVGGVGEDYWSWLQDPVNDFPLINRAVQGAYPPGSVFKVISAATALSGGFIQPGQRLPCPGVWEWNESRYRNWNTRGEAPMDLARSLVRSCDSVYYELSRQMWFTEQNNFRADGREYLSDMSEAWGLGAPTGVDLPAESDGVVPGRVWRREFWQSARDTYCAKVQTLEPGSYAQQVNADLCANGDAWRGGDAVNMSIGQGDVQTTPLQIATVFSAVATKGSVPTPHLGLATDPTNGEPVPVPVAPGSPVPTTADNLAYIESGLVGVTSASDGTAAGTFEDFPIQIAGKTGTAEMKPKQPFAWFAGYNVTPVNGEQYVVVAMVEEGGGGSQTAAPIVRRVFESAFGLGETEIEAGVATD